MAYLSEKRLLLSRTRGACAGTGAHLTPKPQPWKLVLPHEQVAEVTAQPHSPGDKGEEPRERPLPSSPAPQPAVRDMAAAPGRHRAPAGTGRHRPRRRAATRWRRAERRRGRVPRQLLWPARPLFRLIYCFQ